MESSPLFDRLKTIPRSPAGTLTQYALELPSEAAVGGLVDAGLSAVPILAYFLNSSAPTSSQRLSAHRVLGEICNSNSTRLLLAQAYFEVDSAIQTIASPPSRSLLVRMGGLAIPKLDGLIASAPDPVSRQSARYCMDEICRNSLAPLNRLMNSGVPMAVNSKSLGSVSALDSLFLVSDYLQKRRAVLEQASKLAQVHQSARRSSFGGSAEPRFPTSFSQPPTPPRMRF